jgi:hypothetical protein
MLHWKTLCQVRCDLPFSAAAAVENPLFRGSESAPESAFSDAAESAFEHLEREPKNTIYSIACG